MKNWNPQLLKILQFRLSCTSLHCFWLKNNNLPPYCTFYRSAMPHSENSNVPARQIFSVSCFQSANNLYFAQKPVIKHICITHRNIVLQQHGFWGILDFLKFHHIGLICRVGTMYKKRFSKHLSCFQCYFFFLNHNYCLVYHIYSDWKSEMTVLGCKMTIKQILSRGDHFSQIMVTQTQNIYLDCSCLSFWLQNIIIHWKIHSSWKKRCSFTTKSSITCILLRGDIMVAQEVFMIYFHNKEWNIWFRFPKHFVPIYDTVKYTYGEL